MPTDGYRLRTYALAEAYATGGMVNAFRTRKLMVIPYARFLEPRDETALTPHAHQDFEQASVAWKAAGSTTCARPGPPTAATGAPTSTWSSPARPPP